MNDELMQAKIENIILRTMRELDTEDEDVIVEASSEKISESQLEWLARKWIDRLITEELGDRTAMP